MKFCFVCGKKTENLIKGYCEKCYNKEFNLIEVPKEIIFTRCTKCERLREKNIWKDAQIEDLLKNKIKILGKNVSILFEKNDVLHVTARGYLKGSNSLKEEKHDIKIKIKKTVCGNCSKRFGGYYESIIQLRGNTYDAMDFIEDQIIKENQSYRIEKSKRGCDIYLADNNFANKLTNAVKKKFNAKVERNYKLVTRKNGKDIYRSVMLVRID